MGGHVNCEESTEDLQSHTPSPTRPQPALCLRGADSLLAVEARKRTTTPWPPGNRPPDAFPVSANSASNRQTDAGDGGQGWHPLSLAPRRPSSQAVRCCVERSTWQATDGGLLAVAAEELSPASNPASGPGEDPAPAQSSKEPATLADSLSPPARRPAKQCWTLDPRKPGAGVLLFSGSTF